MSPYTVHSIASAPEASKPLLRGLESSLGMIPNLAAVMSESPQLLEGFLKLRTILDHGTFTPAEVQVLALTNAFENGCRYCMSLHSALALEAGVSPPTVEELRSGRSPVEPKLAALSDFSRKLVRSRGAVSEGDVTPLREAGYSRAQALEVVLGVAVSILPNFAHHLTGCPVDDVFRPHLWSSADR